MATQQEFVDALRRGLDAAASEFIEPILMGACDNFDQYQRQVGYIAGIRQARSVIDELVRKANSGEVL